MHKEIKSIFNHKDLNKIGKTFKFKKTVIKKYYDKKEIYNFINDKAIIIQSYVRRYLAKLFYKYLLNSIKYSPDKYLNDSSIIGLSIDDIEKKYFININSHNCDKYFFFDIREINKLIVNNQFINPYTNQEFRQLDIKNIEYHIKILNKNNVSLEFNNEIPKESIITCKITELLTLLSDEALHVDMSIINSFNRDDYVNLINQLLENAITYRFINQRILDNLNSYYYYYDLEESEDKIKNYVLTIILGILKFNEDNEGYNFAKKLIIYNAIQFNSQYSNRNNII